MPHVLLADDDDDLRSILASNFRRAGLEVTEVGNGTELLDLITSIEKGTLPAEQCPDVVVTDVYMPGHNGLEALAQMRRCAQPVPVVVLTAFDDSGADTAARELGASAIFCKPVDLAVLRRKILEIVALKTPRADGSPAVIHPQVTARR
jgi:CheY-like chemotaxis protein